MERIVLRHVSGSKAGRVEEFPLNQYQEIVIGRDPSATVSFSEADAMVGRQHLKLFRQASSPSQFVVSDLNSRNGTFLNGQRVTGTVALRSGDVLQCGQGGPELRFEYVPHGPAETAQLGVPPVQSHYPPAHPLAHVSRPSAAPAPPVAQPVPAQAALAAPAPPPKKSALPWLLGGGGLLALLTLVGGVWFYRNYATPATDDVAKKPAVAPSPAVVNGGGKLMAPAVDGAETTEVEKDQQRAAWRINVAPYQILGSGHPGKAASDFDKPDGVGFSPNGLLYATDARNRRVQVWDVKTGTHLGEFGHGVFGGEIVDIAVAPNGTVFITDQALNLAYVFVPPQPGEVDEKGKPLAPYDYQFKGTRFGEQGFKKLGGIATDSLGRIYVVDAHRNDVHRFNTDYTPDKTFKFEQKRADGDTYLHGCEGIAIDEAAGNLFIASEKDAVIDVFDWESGAYKRRFIGASLDGAGKPAGKHVFFGSVEGLALAQNHLFAVDESAGHIQLFDLARADVFNTDLAGYGAPQPNRSHGYQGFFGHAPQVDFEDKTNLELQKQVKTGAVIPGQANPPGFFCSPDSIASYQDTASGETYIAIADQCNYRLAVYRWSDISKAMGQTIALRESASASKPTFAAVTAPSPVAKPVAKPAPVKPARKPAVVRVPRPAPRPVVIASVESTVKKKKKHKQGY
ncbi:MAG: FHA domain-containing protein [Acidobacteria bacterium]|nr:FHA domain-containing protein [Acidobacteriota bacterium]